MILKVYYNKKLHFSDILLIKLFIIYSLYNYIYSIIIIIILICISIYLLKHTCYSYQNLSRFENDKLI